MTGTFRWALTGTPIQNKESDVFALLKFIRCNPFHEFDAYKLMFGNNANGAAKRLHVLMQPLMLRRTKEQLKAKGVLMTLPEKLVEDVLFKLETEEMNVYQMIMAFSQSLFEQFLNKRAERENDEGYYHHFDTTQKNELYNRLLNLQDTAEVKQHHILTLILRLRQICCHPALILSVSNLHCSLFFLFFFLFKTILNRRNLFYYDRLK